MAENEVFRKTTFFVKAFRKNGFERTTRKTLKWIFKDSQGRKRAYYKQSTSRLKVVRKTAVNALGYGFPIFGKLNKKTNKSSFFMEFKISIFFDKTIYLRKKKNIFRKKL